MPIYEYRCQSCRQKVSLFVRSFSSPLEPVCPECGSRELTRLVSLVSVLKSEESRLEELADPSTFAGLDENDPKSIAQWARKLGREMGEDMGPEFDEMIDQLEAGQLPDELDGEGGLDSDLNGGDFADDLDGGEDE
jgi:putative FmdB family regulatory protein